VRNVKSVYSVQAHQTLTYLVMGSLNREVGMLELSSRTLRYFLLGNPVDRMTISRFISKIQWYGSKGAGVNIQNKLIYGGGLQLFLKYGVI
jgi:hypothetical protein